MPRLVNNLVTTCLIIASGKKQSRHGVLRFAAGCDRSIRELGFSQEEALEAICKVADKARVYPPTKNRAAWFVTVFKEKLYEARAGIRVFKKYKRSLL